jgi:hypothetical protein
MRVTVEKTVKKQGRPEEKESYQTQLSVEGNPTGNACLIGISLLDTKLKVMGKQ